MTSFRFRVKYEYDPTSLWRDVVVGEDRTLLDFQITLNVAVGLDQDHLWFFGTGQDYRDSPVKYRSPREMDPSFGRPLGRDTAYDAGETTVGEMARQLGLGEGSRICYLFDYGSEWRFYAILKEIDETDPADREPTVVKRKGDPVDQYPPVDEER